MINADFWWKLWIFVKKIHKNHQKSSKSRVLRVWEGPLGGPLSIRSFGREFFYFLWSPERLLPFCAENRGFLGFLGVFGHFWSFLVIFHDFWRFFRNFLMIFYDFYRFYNSLFIKVSIFLWYFIIFIIIFT